MAFTNGNKRVCDETEEKFEIFFKTKWPISRSQPMRLPMPCLCNWTTAVQITTLLQLHKNTKGRENVSSLKW